MKVRNHKKQLECVKKAIAHYAEIIEFAIESKHIHYANALGKELRVQLNTSWESYSCACCLFIKKVNSTGCSDCILFEYDLCEYEWKAMQRTYYRSNWIEKAEIVKSRLEEIYDIEVRKSKAL